MLEGASPLNPIYIIKARRASDFIIYYFFFILFIGQQPDKLLFLYHIHISVIINCKKKNIFLFGIMLFQDFNNIFISQDAFFKLF